MSKLFKSSNSTEKRIATLSGHVFVVGNQWVRIPEEFHKQAYAEGCISNDMLSETQIIEDPVELELVALVDFLRDAMTEHSEVFHPKTGRPLVSKIKPFFPSDVTINEFLVKEAWDTVRKELE